MATRTDWTVPTVGNAVWMAATGMSARHVWLGFVGVASPSSTTAVKVPPAVHPPVDDENSVRATLPSAMRRTAPAVSATAWSLRLSSSFVNAPPAGCTP